MENTLIMYNLNTIDVKINYFVGLKKDIKVKDI